jgi:hypothetical protein
MFQVGTSRAMSPPTQSGRNEVGMIHNNQLRRYCAAQDDGTRHPYQKLLTTPGGLSEFCQFFAGRRAQTTINLHRGSGAIHRVKMNSANLLIK